MMRHLALGLALAAVLAVVTVQTAYAALDSYKPTYSTTATIYGSWRCAEFSTTAEFRNRNATLLMDAMCVRRYATTARYAIQVPSEFTASDFALVRSVWADDVGMVFCDDSGSSCAAGYLMGTWDYASSRTTELTFEVSSDTNHVPYAGTFVRFRHNLDIYSSIRNAISGFSAGDAAAVSVTFVGRGTVVEPSTPDSLTVARNAAGTAATVSWVLHEYTEAYEIMRQTAATIGAEALSSLIWGEDITTLLTQTTGEGVDSWEDDTIDADKSYRYRIRARGTAIDSWSDWTSYVISLGASTADLAPPTNLRVSATATSTGGSVIISWTAPVGEFDGYTIQRQELVNEEGSPLFANPIQLPASSWPLGTTTTSFTDATVVLDETYEYRVAAVQSGAVGEYSTPARVSPVVATLGEGPANFEIDPSSDTGRTLADRRNVTLTWEAIDYDDARYEVQVYYRDENGVIQVQTLDYSAPGFALTAFSTTDVRVRGYRVDAARCVFRCYSEWTESERITFARTREALPLPTPIPPNVQLREDLKPVVNEIWQAMTQGQPAVETSPGVWVEVDQPTIPDSRLNQAFQLFTLVGAMVTAGLPMAFAWRRGGGLRSVAVGMACATTVIVFYLGYLLLGIPVAWPAAAEGLLAVVGLGALARRMGMV